MGGRTNDGVNQGSIEHGRRNPWLCCALRRGVRPSNRRTERIGEPTNRRTGVPEAQLCSAKRAHPQSACAERHLLCQRAIRGVDCAASSRTAANIGSPTMLRSIVGSIAVTLALRLRVGVCAGLSDEADPDHRALRCRRTGRRLCPLPRRAPPGSAGAARRRRGPPGRRLDHRHRRRREERARRLHAADDVEHAHGQRNADSEQALSADARLRARRAGQLIPTSCSSCIPRSARTALPISSGSPRRVPESSTTRRPVRARRITWPASCSRRWRVSTSSTSRTRGARAPAPTFSAGRCR